MRHAVDVAAQNRRQIGIHHRRVAARYELHERTHAVRDGDLREADLPRQRFGREFVRRVPVAVHEHDGAAAQAIRVRPLEFCAERGFIQRRDDVAARIQPFIRFDDAFIEHFRQHDVPVEQPRPGLRCDTQRIAKAAP